MPVPLLDKAVFAHIEKDIQAAEKELDDDAESIITNERYIYIASIIKGCYKKKNAGKLSTSDKIDKVVTNRFAALPKSLTAYQRCCSSGRLCTVTSSI